MLDIGTKVRIKSWEEIQKTLDENGRCNGLYFNPDMRTFCGIPSSITTKSSSWYQLKNTQGCYWVPEWFDVIIKSDYLNDGSIEQRSLCLALIRQVMSGNKPNVDYLRHYRNQAFPSEIHNGFSYTDYPQDKWTFNSRIAGNIPDWPCLNLNPEILEEAIKNCLSQHDLEYFKKHIVGTFTAWFIFCHTEKSDFWYKVAAILDNNPKISEDTNIEQPYKTKENEIKFQRRKSTVIRGTLPEGNQQSSGKCKTATCSGHLSYQVCSGR